MQKGLCRVVSNRAFDVLQQEGTRISKADEYVFDEKEKETRLDDRPGEQFSLEADGTLEKG